MPVILATQDTEIRRITVGSHPKQIVLWDPISKKKKNPSQKRADAVAQGIGSDFKPQSWQNKQTNKNILQDYRI
jgi:hypothetical protein